MMKIVSNQVSTQIDTTTTRSTEAQKQHCNTSRPQPASCLSRGRRGTALCAASAYRRCLYPVRPRLHADQHGIPIRFYPLPGKDDDDVTSHASTSKAPQQLYDYDTILQTYDASYDPESDIGRPFAIVSLPSDEDALTLLKKCTVVRGISHLWAMGVTPDMTMDALRHPSSIHQYAPYQSADKSWKADITVVGLRLTYEEKRSRIEETAFMGFQGPVNLTAPAFEWVWWEERWGITGGETIQESRLDKDKVNTHRLTVVGRKIDLPHRNDNKNNNKNKSVKSKSNDLLYAREWIDRLDLKKRSYIGNTSMEAEMSLNLAEMAQAGPGKLVYDPFVGTGSLLIACAALGAYVMGSDIDGRMIRGKQAREDPQAETGIITAAKQYGLRDKFLDNLTFDITQHPWRLARGSRSSSCQCQTEGFMDAIVGDPPYGVRAGAKRLGQRDTHKNKNTPIWLPDKNGYAHEQEDYIPPTRPYALNDLLYDLLQFSSILLKSGGRLVFWMPVMNEDSDATDIPTSKDFTLVACSVQDFGKWARRLVTLQRVDRQKTECSCEVGEQEQVMGETQFHQDSGRYRANVDEKDFRNRYFGPHAQS
ncbi:unnamed protein product [Sympodiomycopsis kandeliae]